MWKILKTNSNNKVEHIVTNKSISYFRAELNPKFVALDIKDFDNAHNLCAWFNRPINSLFDKLKKAPCNYTDPTIAVGS